MPTLALNPNALAGDGEFDPYTPHGDADFDPYTLHGDADFDPFTLQTCNGSENLVDSKPIGGPQQGPITVSQVSV